MPQFTYSATDTTGNVIEGTVSANDMMVAADQVRRMGYTPVRVEVTEGTVPSARPLTAVNSGQWSGSSGQGATSALVNVETEHQPPTISHQPPTSSRPAPLDLSQMYATPEATANTLNTLDTLMAPSLTAGAELTFPTGRVLEPWERSVAANGLTVQELTAPETTSQEVQDVSGANVAGVTGLSTSVMPPNSLNAAGQVTGARVQGREGIRIPYGAGVVRETTTWQRFLEMFVYPIRSGVVMKELAPYLRQFATLINAGLPLYQSLVALESNTPNAKLKEITRQAQRQVQAGGKFSDVMAAFPWIFQPMQVAMVRAAEQGGMLDVTLKQIADYVEHELEIRRLISRETMYPKLTLFMALMILGRYGFVGGMPAFSSLIVGSMGKMTYGIGNYLADTLGFGLLIAIPVIAASIVCRLFLFNVASVRESYDAIKLAIPTIGSITRMFATAKFARTYAALYHGGFPASSALAIAGDACGNAVLKRAALNAIPEVERGGLVSVGLARSTAFPSLALDMLRTGETTGALDQMLDRVADFYEAEGKQKSHQGALIFGVAVFLIVAMIVGNAVIHQWMNIGAQSTTLPGEGHDE